MRMMRLLAVGLLALAAVPGTEARAGWHVGLNIGLPIFYPPCYAPYYYYRPYPVYVAPPPVVVQPAAVLQAAPVAQAACCAPPAATAAAPPTAAPASADLPLAPVPVVAARAPTTEPRPGNVGRDLQRLADADERVRAEAAVELGRLKVQDAVDPLAATLAGDRSPAVRETAARALALIGSPKALPALQRAAQVDADRDVRHSAQFAVEVVQSGSGR
jgi:hypothetical protein